MKTFLLVGNYGVGNFGDEALRHYFQTHYEEVRFQIVSARPQAGEYARFPSGLRSLLSFGWIKTLMALRRSEGMVFGGGTLFTDTESTFACVVWGMHALMAWLCGKRTFLAFQGIGPTHSLLATAITRRVVRSSAVIIVRDSASYERVQKMGREAVISTDPVLALIQKEGKTDAPHVLVAIPRQNSDDIFKETVQEWRDRRQCSHVHILSLQPRDKKEQRFCKNLAQQMGQKASIHPIATVEELCSSVAGAAVVVAERYHGALVARFLERETVIVSKREGDKLASLEGTCMEEWDDLLMAGEVALLEALGIE